MLWWNSQQINALERRLNTHSNLINKITENTVNMAATALSSAEQHEKLSNITTQLLDRIEALEKIAGEI